MNGETKKGFFVCVFQWVCCCCVCVWSVCVCCVWVSGLSAFKHRQLQQGEIVLCRRNSEAHLEMGPQ